MQELKKWKGFETESSSDSGALRGDHFVDFPREVGRIQLSQAVDPRNLFDKKLKHLQQTFFSYDHFNKALYLKHTNTLPTPRPHRPH